MLSLLATERLTLNGVAENFQISRPAISKHIKILTECGLVVIHRQGRQRTCEARLDKLNEVSDWVEQYRLFWDVKLDNLEAYLSVIQTKETKNGHDE